MIEMNYYICYNYQSEIPDFCAFTGTTW